MTSQDMIRLTMVIVAKTLFDADVSDEAAVSAAMDTIQQGSMGDGVLTPGSLTRQWRRRRGTTATCS